MTIVDEFPPMNEIDRASALRFGKNAETERIYACALNAPATADPGRVLVAQILTRGIERPAAIAWAEATTEAKHRLRLTCEGIATQAVHDQIDLLLERFAPIRIADHFHDMIVCLGLDPAATAAMALGLSIPEFHTGHPACLTFSPTSDPRSDYFPVAVYVPGLELHHHDGIRLNMAIPETVLTTVAGRPLASIVSHPVLDCHPVIVTGYDRRGAAFNRPEPVFTFEPTGYVTLGDLLERRIAERAAASV